MSDGGHQKDWDNERLRAELAAQSAPDGKTKHPLVGEVTRFLGASAPTGWLICDGQEVSRTKYRELFKVITTTFGSGNGSTTFDVPNTIAGDVLGVRSYVFTGVQ